MEGGKAEAKVNLSILGALFFQLSPIFPHLALCHSCSGHVGRLVFLRVPTPFFSLSVFDELEFKFFGK